MRIEDALARYVHQLAANGRVGHTTAQVSRHVLAFSRWLHTARLPTQVEQITHENVAQFFTTGEAGKQANGKPRKPTTMNAYRGSLKCFFSYVHGAGYARNNAGQFIQ